MNLSDSLAAHFHQVWFGGNWTDSCAKQLLTDVSWQEATAKIPSFNSIVSLVYHMNYFVVAATQVLQGGRLDAHDKFSFDHPAITSEKEWIEFLEKVWQDAELFASLVSKIPEAQLWETFADEKYGTYYRNIQGIIEHTHYHLGQTALVKKMVRAVTA